MQKQQQPGETTTADTRPEIIFGDKVLASEATDEADKAISPLIEGQMGKTTAEAASVSSESDLDTRLPGLLRLSELKLELLKSNDHLAEALEASRAAESWIMQRRRRRKNDGEKQTTIQT